MSCALRVSGIVLISRYSPGNSQDAWSLENTQKGLITGEKKTTQVSSDKFCFILFIYAVLIRMHLHYIITIFLAGSWYMYVIFLFSFSFYSFLTLPLSLGPFSIWEGSVSLLHIIHLILFFIIWLSHGTNHEIFKYVHMIHFTKYYGLKVHPFSNT